MKILQFSPYQCRVGRGEAGRGWGGVGQARSKKSKPIPTPSRGAGLKSHPITFSK